MDNNTLFPHAQERTRIFTYINLQIIWKVSFHRTSEIIFSEYIKPNVTFVLMIQNHLSKYLELCTLVIPESE